MGTDLFTRKAPDCNCVVINNSELYDEDVSCEECSHENRDCDDDEPLMVWSPSRRFWSLLKKYQEPFSGWDLDITVGNFLKMAAELKEEKDITLYAKIWQSLGKFHRSDPGLELDDVFSMKFR